MFFLATSKKSVPSSVGSENEADVPKVVDEGKRTQSPELRGQMVNRRKRRKGNVSEALTSKINPHTEEEQAKINRQRETEQAEIDRQPKEAEQAKINREREEAAEAKRLQNPTALSGANTVRCDRLVTSGDEFDRFSVGASGVASGGI